MVVDALTKHRPHFLVCVNAGQHLPLEDLNIPSCTMPKYEDDYDHDGYMSTTIVRIIIGAIVVGVLFLLFMWLLPVIGFILTVGLVVLLIVLVVVGLIWLIRGIGYGLADGRRQYKRKHKYED